ncbi:hypothetical protein BCR34DRAFT_598463 [Clohesyomyces aquaticus]|uniref:SNF2 N-terminal domain-containing protein n=1 Tax=Clohesyomyces aquaticus TaxID=1231657 RepID=A0A1Y1ZZ75_9PLEO|nr:hypothetical protein BCR34DRAFT_598463 [Clohesyomyces aquaticus]
MVPEREVTGVTVLQLNSDIARLKRDVVDAKNFLVESNRKRSEKENKFWKSLEIAKQEKESLRGRLGGAEKAVELEKEEHKMKKAASELRHKATESSLEDLYEEDRIAKFNELTAVSERNSSYRAMLDKEPNNLLKQDRVKATQQRGVERFCQWYHDPNYKRGILADDMGLGKMATAISLPSKRPILTGGHVSYVVPASLIEDWMAEFQKWDPSGAFKVLHVHLHARGGIRDTKTIIGR